MLGALSALPGLPSIPECSKGHRMTPMNTLPSNYTAASCDACKASINPSEGFAHCSECNYDLCVTCMKNTKSRGASSGGNVYASGICSCMEDKPSCVDSCVCFCCQAGFQGSAVQDGTGLSILPCLCSLIGLCQCCACMIRRNVAEKYQLGETCPISCAMAYCCPTCSLCQTHRELSYRGSPPGGVCVGLMGGAAGLAAGGLPSLPGMGDGTMPASLARGQEVKSKNGRFKLIHQDDGNVCVYDGTTCTWATTTHGRNTTSFDMQTDGNLVLYDGSTPLWASNTNDGKGKKAIMQDDGNFVIYTADNQPTWATNTVRQ